MCNFLHNCFFDSLNKKKQQAFIFTQLINASHPPLFNLSALLWLKKMFFLIPISNYRQIV